MRAGDFFLVSERDWQSRLIQIGTHGPFNHAGLIVSDDGAIIEALGRGVTAGTLAKYRGARCVVLDSGLTDVERAAAVAFARGCVGDAYDWFNIAAFGINLLTDGRLILGSDGRYICSALVYRAFQAAAPARFTADCHTISPNDLALLYEVQ